MKTKHIFGTILMAALTAACSNEDLQLVEQSAQVGERIELGDVTLSLGEAESRFVVGENFNDLTAQLNDQVGAALIDAPNNAGSTNDVKYNYDLTSYISTNYAFKFDGSKWTTPAKMVEGNYMFYAPYNAEHATRKPIVAKLDAVQQLTATANGIDELSTIKQMIASGNVMAVSHEFLAATDEANVETALVPIYAYPYITLTNNYFPYVNGVGYVATDLVINQVVIKNNAGDFVVEAPFEYEVGKTAISADDDFVYGLRDFTYYNGSENKTVKGAFAKTLGKGAYTSDILGTATKESSAIVVKAPQGGLTLAKNGGTVSFYAVIPAEQYASGLVLDVYTNKGVFTKLISAAKISAGKRYPEAEYNSDGTATIVPSEGGEAAKGELYTVSMETPSSTTTGTLVATTEDLLTLIQNTVANSGNPTLTINALTNDVEITPAVMNAIKAKSYYGWTVKFETEVTIAASLNSANKNIIFNGGAIVKSGTIEINDNVQFVGTSSANSNLTVKGGNVTVESQTFRYGSIINDGGNVTLKAIAYAKNNSGTLTIAKDFGASEGAVITNNGGTVTFVAGTSSTANSYETKVKNAKGTVNVPAYVVAKQIQSNGTDADNKGTITVDGEATIVSNDYGTVTVNGTATVNNNNALITMGSSSATVTVTTNNSYINNTKNGTVTATGKIYYEFTSDVNGKLIAKASKYTLIVLNGMTWAPEMDQEITVPVEMRDATIAIWDPTLEITIDGALTTNNTDDKASKVEGATGAKLFATSIPTEGDDFKNPQGIAQVAPAAPTTPTPGSGSDAE